LCPFRPEVRLNEVEPPAIDTFIGVAMDQTLSARVKLDLASDVVRIDVRGNLTQDSRPSLMRVIRRVRHMGIRSHIRVDLGLATFVESSALAGLRDELNAIGGTSSQGDWAGAAAPRAGVSLELNPQQNDAAVLQPLDLSGDLLASVDTSSERPLTRYSDDELLAASDSVFGMLDDPAELAPTELLASYDEIGLEISRRELAQEPEPA
jgi:hypothetical protein